MGFLLHDGSYFVLSAALVMYLHFPLPPACVSLFGTHCTISLRDLGDKADLVWSTISATSCVSFQPSVSLSGGSRHSGRPLVGDVTTQPRRTVRAGSVLLPPPLW